MEWRNTSRGGLSFTVQVDGHKSWSSWCQSNGEGTMWRVRTSFTTVQPYQFSELVITGELDHNSGDPTPGQPLQTIIVNPSVVGIILDADDALNVPENEDLGIICVRVHQVQLVRKTGSDMRPRSYNNANLPSTRLVHERSKKAGAHCVTCAGCDTLRPFVY